MTKGHSFIIRLFLFFWSAGLEATSKGQNVIEWQGRDAATFEFRGDQSAIVSNWLIKGGSPGIVVMGEDWRSRGHVFESRHRMLDGSFFIFICCKGILLLEKYQKGINRGLGWPIKNGSDDMCSGLWSYNSASLKQCQFKKLSINQKHSLFYIEHWVLKCSHKSEDLRDRRRPLYQLF